MCFIPSNLRPCISLCVGNQQRAKGKNVGYCRLNSSLHPHVVVRRRRRRRLSKQVKAKKQAVLRTQMEIKNMELYLENKSIMEENEKLTKQAYLLHQENQALLFQLQKYSSVSNLYEATSANYLQ